MTELLKQENEELRQQNVAILELLNSDSPLTKKVKSFLEMPHIRAEYLALIPEGLNKEQVLRSEMQSIFFDIMQSDELQKCTPQSFLFCLKDSLSRGLRIGSTHKEAWLIAFKNKRTINERDVWVHEAKIMIGYRAYINKAWNENKIRFVVDTIAKDEVQYADYDQVAGILNFKVPLGKETKLHTQENIEYVYVTAIFEDGRVQSKIYTKESMEEKSKTSRWDTKKNSKVWQLGNTWMNKDRLTDYKEMVQKAALISFSKLLPERGLAELSDFDHRQIEEIFTDVTPIKNTVSQLNAEFLGIDKETGEVLEVKDDTDIPLPPEARHEEDTLAILLSQDESVWYPTNFTPKMLADRLMNTGFRQEFKANNSLVLPRVLTIARTKNEVLGNTIEKLLDS